LVLLLLYLQYFNWTNIIKHIISFLSWQYLLSYIYVVRCIFKEYETAYMLWYKHGGSCRAREKFKRNTRRSRVSLTSRVFISQYIEGSMCGAPVRALVSHHRASGSITCSVLGKYFSTETLLIYLTDVWLKEMNKGNLNGLLLIDFRKAFDISCQFILDIL
jgi:hypothetical protein